MAIKEQRRFLSVLIATDSYKKLARLAKLNDRSVSAEARLAIAKYVKGAK